MSKLRVPAPFQMRERNATDPFHVTRVVCQLPLLKNFHWAVPGDSVAAVARFKSSSEAEAAGKGPPEITMALFLFLRTQAGRRARPLQPGAHALPAPVRGRVLRPQPTRSGKNRRS